MIMRDSHLEPAMARSTKRDQVIEQVCIILEFVVASTFDVMNVKRSPAGAMGGSAIMANLVAFKNLQANLCPPPPVGKLFSASPVWAFFASHVFNGTTARAIFPAVLNLGGKHGKRFATMETGQNGMGFSSAGVGTLSRTMLNAGDFLIKSLATIPAFYVCLLFFAPVRLALPRTKYFFGFFSCTVFVAFKFFAAMLASKQVFISLIRAMARAVSNSRIIGLKFFSTTEAYLDHR